MQIKNFKALSCNKSLFQKENYPMVFSNTRPLSKEVLSIYKYM